MSDLDMQEGAHADGGGRDIETRAKEMGWTPLERFRGDPSRWVDAQTFVERGETMLPLIRADKKRLETEVSQARAEIRQLSAVVAGQHEAMVEFTEQARKEQVEALDRQRAELTAALATAREEGDVAREVQVQDELAELREQRAEAKKAPPQQRQATPPVDAEFNAWRAENPWYGTDAERTMDADYIGRKLALQQPLLKGRPFYDRVAQILAEQEGTQPARVGTSRPAGGTGSGGAGPRGYNDLSADARAVCDRQASKFVGDGKMFKTVAEWRTYYCKQIGDE